MAVGGAAEQGHAEFLGQSMTISPDWRAPLRHG
jgi:hypothetical protein